LSAQFNAIILQFVGKAVPTGELTSGAVARPTPENNTMTQPSNGPLQGPTSNPAAYSDAASERREPIAIVGIGCRFPGGANGPGAFWRMLCDGVDAIREVPPDRWDIGTFYCPKAGILGKTNARWGGFIDDIDRFDAAFFGISPREAALMDPQQRLLLEVAWEAIEDGGLPLERLTGQPTAVYVGISSYEYALIQNDNRDYSEIDTYTNTGSAQSIAANRISYCFNLRGPSVAIDTACSSALVAVHLACTSIWNGEANLALAGGVNALIWPGGYVGFSRLSMLSPDGRCKAFAADANGFVRSEGAGIVVLKPLAQALADGDRSYALIRSTGCNQDGRTGGMTVPSQVAQEELLRQTCRQAGIDPAQIQYVEAHGTGTLVGDPIEARALGNVLSVGRPSNERCLVGSVKTNVGHLEPASGIAGLIKLALALKHQQIPASLHFNTPNPDIPFDALKLRVPVSLQPFPRGAREGPALATINSFGFGGTNANAVLQEAILPPEFMVAEGHDSDRAQLVPLSARTADALRALAGSYHAFLTEARDCRAAHYTNFLYTAAIRRTHHDYRVALVARTRDELLEELRSHAEGQAPAGAAIGRVTTSAPPSVAFVFSGQGPQWWAMGRQLMATESVFRDVIRQCDALMAPLCPWSLWDELHADEAASRLGQTAIAQPALFAIQVALAALWQSWGVKPDAVVGHSVGEVAAAYVAGALRLEDAVRVIVERGRCMDLASSRGRMLAVGLSADTVRPMLAAHGDRVSLAAVNSPRSITLSGTESALEELAKLFEKDQAFCRFLKVGYAFHSAQMDPIREELLRSLANIQPRRATLPFISTVTGRYARGSELGADYWWQNVRQTVLFADAVNHLVEGNYLTIVELGPHPVLGGSLSECLAQRGRTGTVLASLRRNEDERATLLRALGTLYTLNYPLRWEGIVAPGQCITLPSYPWQRESYWHEPEDARVFRLGKARHPLLGRTMKTPQPTWEGAFDPQRLAYLEDHKVLGRVVIPAMAYLEMALAAGHELFPTAPCLCLEQVKLDKACFLADGAGPAVQTVYNPDESTFKIFTRPSTSTGAWTTHVGGVLRARTDVTLPSVPTVEQLQKRCARALAIAENYARFVEMGLIYGPTFQGIQQLSQGDGEALGEIGAPHGADQAVGYYFHPAVLDACIQVIFGALPSSEGEHLGIGRGVYLPVEVAEVRVYGAPTARLWSHAQLVERTTQSITADVRVYNESGQLTWEARGLRCQAVGADAGSTTERTDDLLYAFQWHFCPRADVQPARRQATYLCAPSEIVEQVQLAHQRRTTLLGVQQRDQRYNAGLDQLCRAYILQAFHKLGTDLADASAVGQRFTTTALARRLAVVERHERLIARLLEILAEDGDLGHGPDGWTVLRVAGHGDPQVSWKRLLADHPASYPDLTLVRRCGESLAEVLRGVQDPLQLIFPDGSLATSEHFYQDAPFNRFVNLAARDAVQAALGRLPQGQKLRVLEIGAGTGGLTDHLLPVLPAGRTAYVFTDLSTHFFTKAEHKFSDYPWIEYQRLDIENSPLEQGFASQSFDLVLASQALHATADLRQTLKHALELLAPEGLLVLVESVVRFRWIDLVFGLLEGWWRFADRDLRPNHALLEFARWRDVLGQLGFTDIRDACQGDSGLGKVVLLARAPGARGTTEVSATPTTPALNNGVPRQKRWLILADRCGVAEVLDKQLRARGDACTLVYTADRFSRPAIDRVEIVPGDREQMRQVLSAASEGGADFAVVHLWNLDTPASDGAAEPTTAMLDQVQDANCLSVVHLLQTWARALSAADGEDVARLWLVTRRAQSVFGADGPLSLGQAPVWGLARVLANEFRNVRCQRIDLDDVHCTAGADVLLAELTAPDAEDEIAWRGTARYVHRYMHTSLEQAARDRSRAETPDAFQLEIAKLGSLDGLIARARRRDPLPAGAVEIEVAAAGLNFSDVMKALGLYPGLGAGAVPLGIECGGTISAVGAGVDRWRVGDRVIAVAPFSFASHVIIDHRLVAPLPAHLNFEEGATIPIAFLTAYHALHYLGRMTQGERVLIHSATGGVGLAAVQLAQVAGAEVLATAGSAEKRELLRALGVGHVFDSRSLAFADQVLEATQGAGVDLILNSLSGEAIPKGLAVLADHGRFLEIGKRDIYGNSKVGLLPFRKNLSFIAIDLDRALRLRRGQIGEQFGEVVRLVAEGKLSPLAYRPYPMSRLSAAFRAMAQAKHTGKIVLTLQDPALTIAPHGVASDAQGAFPADATYLLTGGLGGFGLAVAKWLVAQGARHLVLVGRSGAQSGESITAVAELEAAGACVVVEKADVSQPDQVAAVLGRVRHSMPPLRGVVHAAMVLDDCLIVNLTGERLRRVLAPKMAGAWNLHCQTRDLPLDFFVLFSSMSAVFGQGGQANYAAANAFLDALAHHRRALGLAGLSINWGSLGDVGYVARNIRVAEQFETMGIRHLTSRQALSLLGSLVRRQAVEAGIMRVNWSQWRRALSDMAAVAPRFSLLAQAAGPDDETSTETVGVTGRHALLAAVPAARRDLLIAMLRDKIARVLGTTSSKLDIDKPLTEVGLDSLMAVELRNWIEIELRCQLPIVELMQGPSVTRLADNLLRQLEKDSQVSPAAPGTGELAVASTAPEVLPTANGVKAEEKLLQVDNLSEAEIDSVLGVMLAQHRDAK
jgi:acyl transferase domain-containing protein/NADPH:quinone reductase-like Zn-dependent oxidoreductase/SAM-dependent methyltransferase/acyl carrier protein